MGRRHKKLPTPVLMGAVAHSRLRKPVLVENNDYFSKPLQLKPSSWRKLSVKQKLTAANIALHRTGEAYAFTLVLSKRLHHRLSNPALAQQTFEYVRDRMLVSFSEAGLTEQFYWYVLENADRHALSGLIDRRPPGRPAITRYHLHGAFALQDHAGSLDLLRKQLEKNLGGNEGRALRIIRQGSKDSHGVFSTYSIPGLVGYPRYACKNLPITVQSGIRRPFVLSRNLQQACVDTLDWLSAA